MTRWFAALLVIITAVAFTAAQDTGEKKPLRFPFGSSKSQLPFGVVQVDGQTAWRIAGRGNVKLDELIAGYSSATGKRVSYERRAADAAQYSVPYVAPDDGMVVKHAELGDFVSGIIAARELTLVGHSTDNVHVVPLDYAAGYARVVDTSELDKLPDTEWVTIARPDLQTSRNRLAATLSYFRSADVVISSQGSLFVAAGRVEQIRNVNRIIEMLDSSLGSDGTKVEAYDLSPGLKASDAIRVIGELFEEPSQSIRSVDGGYTVKTETRKRVQVSVAPSGSRLLVRATAQDQALVKSALDAMK